jgi:hypothetical protein
LNIFCLDFVTLLWEESCGKDKEIEEEEEEVPKSCQNVVKFCYIGKGSACSGLVEKKLKIGGSKIKCNFVAPGNYHSLRKLNMT